MAMVPVYVHGGLQKAASRTCRPLLNNALAQLFVSFFGAAGLTNCWLSVFFDGFGTTAK